MASPSVSVLLPVRDGAEHLAEALESLSAQTLDDFEAIVVDDGSRDESAELVRAHARHDGRFRLITQERLGIVAALERARVEARGRYLARMDADDVALSERLALQVAALAAEPELAACGGGVTYVSDGPVTEGARRYERWVNSLVTPELAARDVFVECPLPHPTLVARRDALAGVGAYRRCGWPEDYDLILRLWAAGARFRNLEARVLLWREHPERLSRTDAAYSLDAFRRCKAHHLRGTLLRPFEGAVVFGAGPAGKAFARELVRQGGRVLTFVEVDSRKIGRTIHGAPVVPIDDAPRCPPGLWIAAVSGEEARAEIREVAAAAGRREGVDFVAVA